MHPTLTAVHGSDFVLYSGSVLAAADIRKTKKMGSIVNFKTWKAGEQNMNLFLIPELYEIFVASTEDHCQP